MFPNHSKIKKKKQNKTNMILKIQAKEEALKQEADENNDNSTHGFRCHSDSA